MLHRWTVVQEYFQCVRAIRPFLLGVMLCASDWVWTVILRCSVQAMLYGSDSHVRVEAHHLADGSSVILRVLRRLRLEGLVLLL